MAEIKITSDVAGRVCAISIDVGAKIGSGDDIIVVEAMKMEIPVAASAGGEIKSILVKVDDIIAEGDVVAIVVGS